MKVENVKMDEIRLLEGNPRKHPEVQIEALMSSVEQFGQYRPIVVDEGGVILAGNGLFTALGRLGKETATIHRVVGLSQSQKDKLILADNKTGSMSKDDFARIDEMLRSLDDYEVPGYDPDVLRELLGTAEDVLDTANDYGTLDDEVRERLMERVEPLNEDDERATVGTTPTPAQPVPDDVKTGAGGGATCPTCRRAW